MHTALYSRVSCARPLGDYWSRKFSAWRRCGYVCVAHWPGGSRCYCVEVWRVCMSMRVHAVEGECTRRISRLWRMKATQLAEICLRVLLENGEVSSDFRLLASNFGGYSQSELKGTKTTPKLYRKIRLHFFDTFFFSLKISILFLIK